MYESIAAEFAELVQPSGDLRADDVVKTLAQLARRADIDPELAVAAVCIALLGTRPPRDDDLRAIQVEIVIRWFTAGWADG